MAKSHKVLLRIEDHDRGRSRPQFEHAILRDLKWLGFRFANEASFQDGTPSKFRQSDNSAYYESALEKLRKSFLVYDCTCSRKQIKELMVHRGFRDHPELLYFGTCREASIKGTSSNPSGLRLLIPPLTIEFLDYFLGKVAQDPAGQCGDLLLQDRLKQWTYHFAVVVDDFRQGVNLIIRGTDLLDSTARQIYLDDCLCYPTPQFAHHPLLQDSDGRKLGKRYHSLAIKQRRAEGALPETVLGEAAFLMNLKSKVAPISLHELLGSIQQSLLGSHHA
jgi:glutamyl-Q tRNA(Asp) synthetase